MATLQTLRNKAGVFIAIMIGVALLAFILTDLLGSKSSVFSNDDTIGRIDGEKIKVLEYQRKVEEMEAFTKMNQQTMSLNDEVQSQIRENVWQNFVQEIAFGKQYQKAGIDVTPEELYDMAVGNHIAQSLRPLFSDPQTGIYNRSFAQNFLMNKGTDPQAAFYWSFIEKGLKNERLGSKYVNLVRKSLYCTNNQVEFEKSLRAKNADIQFVGIRYSAIADSTVNVSDSEIKSAYNGKKDLYKVDDARDIEYVVFPIQPTEADRAATEEYVAGLVADFSNPETDAVRFASINAETPVASRFRSLSELGAIADWASAAKVGEVYGPYKDGNSYCISRLVAVEQRPDTVKASHILIRSNETLADSLFQRAKAGDNFAALARKFSEDSGSAINGGDLGWFSDGTMVSEFNEACFTNPKGSILKVQTTFGTHIINVVDKGVANKKYNVATVDKSVQYSSKTHQNVFNVANQFALDNRTEAAFDANADSLRLARRKGVNIRKNAHSISTIHHARDIVKWAYGAEVGEVSDLFECDDEFIVAKLVKTQDKGYAKIADVSTNISRDLRREKKAEMIGAFADGKSLAEVAANYNAKIDTASNVSFAANTIPGIGMEPNLIGSVAGAEAGAPIQVVKGNNAVYIYTVTSKNDAAQNDAAIRSAIAQQYSNVEYSLSKYINDIDVEDNRIKFY